MDSAVALEFTSGKPKEWTVNLWLHRFAVFTAAATVFLIVAGAAVTSTGSGDAVPDWPLSYGTLLPEMSGGVLFEHGHRMVAGFTALLITLLAVWLWRSSYPRWLKMLGLFAFLCVIQQALLGGLRVLVVSDPQVQSTAVTLFNAPHVAPVRIGFAVAHATLAQIVLCLAFAIALFTSRGFAVSTASEAPPTRAGLTASSLLIITTTGTTVLLFIQLILGALMRHTQAGLIIPDFPLSFGKLIPPFGALPHDPNDPFPLTYRELQFKVAIHFAHRVGALFIAAAVTTTAVLVWRHFRRCVPLTRLASLLMLLTLAQITLGACVIWTELAAPVTVAHVVTGASILGFSLLTTIWSWRLRHSHQVLS
ncbi:MAG: COX15/CtaA family protein [Abditibacteriales bacterium]|nr:COX15/CtaA family protein [Abditibacteriales bacterium]MDW8366641.1 COX15/CtaA family protein [Abditibacteriales bacterium]